MATLRDIRRRIASVRNTRQITAAMRMVSAAKLNRAQTAVRMARPYAHGLFQVIQNLSRGLTGEDHPFFRAA
ncbi:MAG: F0F1 ATP synthase subunit gamma, partial [SAR324 cluster bacterium]